MNKIFQKQKIIEAIGEGTMGSSSGVVGGLYFTEDILLIILLGGIGAVLGKVIFPLLVEIIPKLLNIKNKTISKIRFKKIIIVFVIVLLGSGYGYLTIDNYSKGQKLYTIAKVKLKKQPGVGGKTLTYIKSNSEVTYLEKGWKRIRWYEDGKRFFSFWRKVKDQNGRIGWIYGGYLSDYKL